MAECLVSKESGIGVGIDARLKVGACFNTQVDFAKWPSTAELSEVANGVGVVVPQTRFKYLVD